MKMAKASEADLNMAMKLANFLESIERGNMPDDLSADSDFSERIDTSHNEQYDRLIDGLQNLLNQGSIMRVIFGMVVVCDPRNRCLDPNADTLEEHPDFEKAEKQRDQLITSSEAMAETIRAIAGLVTYEHESKGDFIGRVRAVLGEDPDIRVSVIRQQRDDLLSALEKAIEFVPSGYGIERQCSEAIAGAKGVE